MTSYERFGEFYDAVMGDRRAAGEQVLELIRGAKPDAKNVLELGCGTGSMLKHLQDAYEVSGLDISSKMLSIARKKVPRSKLYRQDMVDFRIDGHNGIPPRRARYGSSPKMPRDFSLRPS